MDGYPSDPELDRIKTWPVTDLPGLFEYVIQLWNPYGSWTNDLKPEERAIINANPNRTYLRLATGGWSGNEDIIGALSSNAAAWSITWQLSARGGLYIFETSLDAAPRIDKASIKDQVRTLPKGAKQNVAGANGANALLHRLDGKTWTLSMGDHTRFGTATQITDDIMHFRENGTLPRSKGQSWA